MAILRLLLASLAVTGSILQVSGTRAYDRRSDVVNPPSVSSLDWSAPLSSGNMTLSLPPIPQGDRLTYLALGRGHRTFNCELQGNDSLPSLTDETATLINVEPLLLFIHDESEFHSLPAEIIQFDYSQLNTTYDCYGSFNLTNTTAIFEFEGHEEIRAEISEVIPSAQLEHDMDWRSGETVDSREKPNHEWYFYIVETVGGAIPQCGMSRNEIRVEYAAEFWLYHSTS